ncbi:MAG: SDR family NAD(P)-dependent oxidoreductase [Planctomycetota bacterium]
MSENAEEMQTDTGWTVLTGSTGGLGAEIVAQLAARGRAMVWINRSAAKAEAQRTRLLAQHPELKVELVAANLMDTGQIATAAAAIDSIPGRIDALYNNSGVLTAEKVLSAQGVESQFAVNTLAPYQLLRALQGRMARPAADPPAMVVNLSSSVIQRLKTLDVGELADPPRVGGLMSTYAQTKLAVTALAPALADELKADNILIRAIDPGATKTAMTTGGSSGMPRLLSWLAPLLFRPADEQAAKLVESADPAAHESRTGVFVGNRRVRKMPRPAADPAVQTELVALLDGLLSR